MEFDYTPPKDEEETYAADEFAVEIPMGDAEGMMPDAEMTVATAEPEAEPAIDQSAVVMPKMNVWVNADSITASEFSDQAELAKFDVVLTVTCVDEHGVSTSKKVVKTVAFDKQKLMDSAMNAENVTIVENTMAPKQEEKRKSNLLKTLRQNAGIPGKDTYV